MFSAKLTKDSIRAKTIKLFPTVGNCENCGTSKNVIRHHLDYSKADKIMFLCGSCHSKWHAKNKAKEQDIHKQTISVSIGRGMAIEIEKYVKKNNIKNLSELIRQAIDNIIKI